MADLVINFTFLAYRLGKISGYFVENQHDFHEITNKSEMMYKDNRSAFRSNNSTSG